MSERNIKSTSLTEVLLCCKCINLVDLSWAWSNLPTLRAASLVVARENGLPRRRRTIVPSKVRAEVVERYKNGETTREVADACNIGKTTVLGILREAGVEIRPWGRHY